MSDAVPTEPAPSDAAAATKPNLHQRFAEAWINSSHRVCGVRLDPYCLHHILLLDVLKNPLGDAGAGGDSRISWGNLFQAVIACRSPYEAEVSFPRWSMRWELRVTWLTLVHRLLRRPGTALEWHCRAFRAYQNDFESQPDLYFDDNVQQLTAPGLLAKAVFMQMHLHMDERRIFTMPIGKALFIYAAAVEQLSDARLLEPAERTLYDWLRKIQNGEIPMPEGMAGGEEDRPPLSAELFGEEAANG